MTARYIGFNITNKCINLKRESINFRLNKQPGPINRIYYLAMNDYNSDMYYYKLTPGYPTKGTFTK